MKLFQKILAGFRNDEGSKDKESIEPVYEFPDPFGIKLPDAPCPSIFSFPLGCGGISSPNVQLLGRLLQLPSTALSRSLRLTV